MISPAKAISLLESEGAFQVMDRASALAAKGRDIINLGIGQPDFKTAPHIVEAAVKALRDGHHGYSDPAGIAPLRDAVAADLHARLGVEVSPDSILVVPGGKVTMFFAALLLGEPGREILFPDPGFPIYRSVARYSGAQAIPYPLSTEAGFGFQARDILSRMSPRTSLVMINSPGNPTGGVTARAEIEALVEGLAAYPNAVLLSDEIYGRMLYDGTSHASLLEFPEIRDRLILLDGWSKTYAMTGWRLGYGIWPSALVDAARKLAVNCHSCVNTAAQYAGLAALQGPQDTFADMLATFDRRRRLVIAETAKLGGVDLAEPKGAFYSFPKVFSLAGACGSAGSDWSAGRKVAHTWLEDLGIATIAGDSFGAWGADHLRLSYANSDEKIEAAFDRIRRWQERVA